ncbi:MAG: N-methyl-L-tryptophan oxidase [Gemmatimonadaceae bacterium]|nr:N-methyl-L-tryptophan oxidase [Gemmatimonadaceae bacterium]
MSAGSPKYDTVIVGLGAMGSAALYHLASRGVKVIGVDRYAPPHIHGSTHGRTRIIREAYYEHPCYVPIVKRAYELWSALEREAGEQLFVQTGGLMIGPPNGLLFAGALRSAEEHELEHTILNPAEVTARYPGFQVPEGSLALLEPRAGLLFPEKCVEAHLALAQRAGATIRTGVAVTGWDADEGVRVMTDAGELRAETLIIAAGPWLSSLVPELELPLEIERQLFHWFEPSSHPEWYAAAHSPISLIEYAEDRYFATFPDVGDGVKAGIHHEGAVIDIDAAREPASAAEGAEMLALLARYLPEAAGTILDRATCVYTNTPDHDFVLDAHPEHPNVIIASPCSGHGFKFSSAVGEILADLITKGETTFDLSPFAISRLVGGV